MKMKKALAIFAAVALAAGTVSASAADNSTTAEVPEDYFTFKSYCYFKTKADENIRQLNENTFYINTSELPEEGVQISTDVYLVMKYKDVFGGGFFKTGFDSDQIKLMDIINTAEECGEVFKGHKDVSPSISRFPSNDITYEYDVANFSLYTYGIAPIQCYTEKTDDYPLYRIVSQVDKSSGGGRFKLNIIEFIPRWTSSEISYHYPDRDPETGDLLYTDIYTASPAYYSQPNYFVVSDRELGDVNNDGKVDEADAELIISDYGNASNDHITNYQDGDQFAAMDVNTDGEVNAEDAEIILDYALSGEEISFYEYLGR